MTQRMEWQAYLEKAQSNLRVAELAYSAGEYDSAASRAYYAVFHAEIAALLRLTDFRPARWSHERVQAEFTRRLIHAQKVFVTELRSIHHDLFGRRQVADYEEERIARVVAERSVRKAREMVLAIARTLMEEQP
jgi:uncharacterized protein (UPF0332 family)